MDNEQNERAAIVAWLQDAPFPWLNHKAPLLERIRAAWLILRHGEACIGWLFTIAAVKIKRGDHLKDNTHG